MIQKQRILFPIEKLTRPELLAVQEKRLLQQIHRCAREIPFYEHLWPSAANAIGSYEEFRDLIPFTTKSHFLSDGSELQQRRARSSSAIVSLHLTSGTTGLGQEVHPLTQFDVEALASTWTYQARWAGLDFGDRVAYTFPVGLQTGGLWSNPANEKLHTIGLQLGPYSTEKKIEYILRFQPHGIVISPAFLNRFQAIFEAQGKDPRKLLPCLKAIFIAGESYSIEWAERAMAFWGAHISEWYGCMQAGINLAISAEEGVFRDGKRGALLCMEHRVLCEVLNPDTNEPARPGEEGEMVVTNLFREAFPVVRFRTGDRVRLSDRPAACGRPFLPIEAGTVARYDDMMKIRGQNLWPDAVDKIVFSEGDIEEYAGLVSIDENGREIIALSVEFKSSEKRDQAAIDTRLKGLAKKLQEHLNLRMEIRRVDYMFLPRYEFKVRRWIDERRNGRDVVRYVRAD